jgi:hypothetical protein
VKEHYKWFPLYFFSLLICRKKAQETFPLQLNMKKGMFLMMGLKKGMLLMMGLKKGKGLKYQSS